MTDPAHHLAKAGHDQQDSSPPFEVTPARLRLDRMILFHVGGLIVMATWAFGGNADWARTLIAGWASFALPLLVWSGLTITKELSCAPRVLHCLWPLLGLNALVIISLFFPGFRVGYYGDETLYISNRVPTWLPSSARPRVTLEALWLFTGVYLSAFNLMLTRCNRQSLRRLLFVLLTNGLALAVFGTFQKLTKAEGLYFGLQPSPQPRFFASFIYHNHWGAFCVLTIAAGLGLFFHYLRRHELRELARTPAIFVLIATLAIAITVPMSGSRSCTLLIILLLGLALIHWIRLASHRRQGRGGRTAPMLLGSCVLVALIAVTYPLAKPAIEERLRDTRQQIDAAKQPVGVLAARLVLYRDTWHMARDRLPFGWGMASFPHVFTIYNTQSRGKADRLPHYYHDAHSDWLQTLAELGIAGSALLALCALAPLWRRRRHLANSLLAMYLLGGCALLLLYAWVEFPFGNVAVGILFWVSFFFALRYNRVASLH